MSVEGERDAARLVPTGPVPGERLTQREHEVLHMIEQGLTTSDMAVRLGRTRRVVQFHVSNLLGKLGARSRTELVHLARKRNLLS